MIDIRDFRYRLRGINWKMARWYFMWGWLEPGAVSRLPYPYEVVTLSISPPTEWKKRTLPWASDINDSYYIRRSYKKKGYHEIGTTIDRLWLLTDVVTGTSPWVRIK